MNLPIILAVFFLFACMSSECTAPDNSVLTLKPYWYNGTWVFDDANVNLSREAFVAGIPEMINHMTKHIPNAREGFRLLFSASEFPDYQLKIDWVREGNGGNWYYSDELKMEGWLCPALFKYFKDAPKRIYAKAEALNK
jgi:hypothetical protein